MPFHLKPPSPSAEGCVWPKENQPHHQGHGSGLKCQTHEFGLCSGNGEMTSPAPSVYMVIEKKKSFFKRRKGKEKVKMHKSTLEHYPMTFDMWALASRSQVRNAQSLLLFEVLWEKAFTQRLSTTKTSPEPSWIASKGHGTTKSRTHISPPSIHDSTLLWSHDGISSIQNKHVITNLRLIDAICVPCPLGFSWSLPDSDGHRPQKPQGTHDFGPWQMLLAVLYPCDSKPSQTLSTLRLWAILQWVSSGMRLSVQLSFALSKCLCCISLILIYTFVFVLTPLKLGYSSRLTMRKYCGESGKASPFLAVRKTLVHIF